MVQALYSESPYLILGYSFVTLSYLNVNILYIRLILIIASIFLLLHAIIMGKVFVDMVVFNVVFIVINGIYSYFLIMRLVKVKLTPIEERIFERDFKKVMDRTTFRDFIRKAHLRTFSEGAQIVHLNNTFTGLYYIALLNPNYTVDYYKEGEKYFSVGENSWIGVVEYSMYEKERKKRDMLISKETAQVKAKSKTKAKRIKIKWGLSAVVSAIPDTTTINQDSLKVLEPIYDEEDEPCYVYEFPLSVLEKMFSIKDEGILYKNALYSVWLSYTTKAIEKVDEEVVVHKKSFKVKKSGTLKSNRDSLQQIKDNLDKPIELGGISQTYNNDDEFFENDQNRFKTGARFIENKNLAQRNDQ